MYRSVYLTGAQSHRLDATRGSKTVERTTTYTVSRTTQPRQSAPGEEPWIQPPYRAVSHLKIAPDADSVGFYG
eukprot:m.72762 g.72762  ORF g.72762 m.72762 type:complete len:73 (+) comp7694_c1_seq1:719-937(+)